MGLGGTSRSTNLPSISTWPAGCTMGRLCSVLEVVFTEMVALIILVGREVASCVIANWPGVGDAWTVFVLIAPDFLSMSV